MSCLVLALAISCLLAADSSKQEQNKDEKTTKAEAATDDTLKAELASFQGTWICTSLEVEGKPTPANELTGRAIFYGSDKFVVRKGARVLQAGIQKLHPTKRPKAVDAGVMTGQHEGETMLGIYDLDKDTLKVCFDPEGQKRPTEFKTSPNSGLQYASYRRAHPIPPNEISITGLYQTESLDPQGRKLEITVEIERRGDAYLLKWRRGGLPVIRQASPYTRSRKGPNSWANGPRSVGSVRFPRKCSRPREKQLRHQGASQPS